MDDALALIRQIDQGILKSLQLSLRVSSWTLLVASATPGSPLTRAH